MLFPRFAFLILPASSFASGGAHGSHLPGDDITTTTTTTVYVTVTRTITTSGNPYTVVLTRSISGTSTTATEEATGTPYPTVTPYSADVPCPADTITVEGASSNTTCPTVSGATIRANTTHATSTIYGSDGVAVKAGAAVVLMAFVGVVVAML